jgi:acyl carrier protein
MAENDELAEAVAKVVAEVLSLDRAEITPASRFFADLGGESIDVLDVSFRLQQQFGVQINFQKMLALDGVHLDDRGRLSPEWAATVRSRFPSLDAGILDKDFRTVGVQDLLTVGVITDCLRLKLAEPRPAAEVAEAAVATQA